MNAQWLNARGISERIIVKGKLFLETPAHFGNGDTDGPTDMPLLLDPLEGRALLTGTSIAGALRSYLREYEYGYGYPGEDEPGSLTAVLFGSVTPDDESVRSPLIVDDSLSKRPEVELRDGVAISPKTRTAEDGKKFDLELLVAGTTFELFFELLVLENNKEKLLEALAITLRGLERGEIGLGKRKRRGYGQCRVKEWEVYRYDVSKPEGLISWLVQDESAAVKRSDIVEILGTIIKTEDKRKHCTLEASFALDGSLLIRSGFGEPGAPDAIHLRSKRKNGDEPVPVLSGTSLAGAIRARALRIVKTVLTGKPDKAEELINEMFGLRRKDENNKQPLTASRLWVKETVINDPLELVQNRIKIDRFTGGAFPGALFSEQPVFGAPDTVVHVGLCLQQPKDCEVGLLLLLLKDLWLGDLPLGGGAGIGRGRLRGLEAGLSCAEQEWKFTRNTTGELYVEGDKAHLENFIQALREVEQDGNRE